MYDIRAYFKDWNWWDYSWTIIASVIGTWIGLQWGAGGWNTALSITTMLTGLWCVILVAKGRILNYYIGIINILGYSWIAYNFKLYGEVQLNMLYYLPMSFWGIWVWSKNKDTYAPDMVEVQSMSWIAKLNWAGLSVVAIGFYGIWLRHIGDQLPFIDATSTVLSIFGMFLLVHRYAEQWIMWIIVDVVSVIMWCVAVDEGGARDPVVLVMWIAFLVNAIYGMFSWRALKRKQI